MCYICKCFGWALDFIQRVLTFALACIMCLSICIGVSVAIAAGIAYGYNYMLAEFLTLGRTDLAVYVRRGQFNDKPNFGKGFRRKGDEDDLFSSNSSDYQDTKIQSDTKPLSDTWRKALDTRKYAQKLTKYSQGQHGADNFFNFNSSGYAASAAAKHAAAAAAKHVAVDHRTHQTDTPTDKTVSIIRRVYSITPNQMMPTTIHPARTDIVMRNFAPVDNMTPNTLNLDEDFYQDHAHANPVPKRKKTKEKSPDIKINLKENKHKSYVPPREFSKIKPSLDYGGEEIDEDNIVYRPV